MKNMIRDSNSGALLYKPTAEEQKLEKLEKMVNAIFSVLTETQKQKVNKKLEGEKHAT